MRVVLVVSRIIIITILNQNVKSLSLKKYLFWLKSFKSIVCQICNKLILGLFFERENIEEKLFSHQMRKRFVAQRQKIVLLEATRNKN